MKKLSILITSLVLLLSCNQTKSNNETTRPNDNSVQVADTISKTVKLSAQPEILKLSALPDSITVLMTNNITDTITTGLHYSIEIQEANEWKEISPKDIVFNDLGWRLKPNDTESFAKKLYKDQIDYKAGKYRIVKHYLKSDYLQTKEDYTVLAKFSIEE